MSKSPSSSPCDPQTLRDVVAIDGPSGAGKSTVARALASALGYAYLDTGAMYRAVTWALLERNVDAADGAGVQAVVADLDLRLDACGALRIGERDVRSHLRSHEVESRVSAVSAIPAVRSRMRELQRRVALAGPVVAEGRDMGSVVFPAARWKLYLDASADERARRRHRDFLAAGRDVSEEMVREEMAVRDSLDSTRRDAPLRRADDATYFDTTGLSIAEVVQALVRMVRGQGEAGAES